MASACFLDEFLELHSDTDEDGTKCKFQVLSGAAGSAVDRDWSSSLVVTSQEQRLQQTIIKTAILHLYQHVLIATSIWKEEAIQHSKQLTAKRGRKKGDETRLQKNKRITMHAVEQLEKL